MIIIPLGSDVRAEVIDSVLGQLSDGIWENSSAMNKYWKYADVNENNELEVDDSRWDSGFSDKDEAWIKNWFANKAKQVVKIWADDWGKGKDIWSRDNTSKVDYMGGHKVRDITVADVYECYDFLKGRAKARKYGTPEKEVPVEEPISSTPAPAYTSPKTSGGMNPSQQELEDFFLDASTKVRKRGISASRKIVASSEDSYSYYMIDDCAYSVERISDTFCELIMYKNKRFMGSWDFSGPDAYGQALAKILAEDEITSEEYDNIRDGSYYPDSY